MTTDARMQRLLAARAVGRAAALAICTGDTIERHHANTGERPFPIYSVTKTFIAATALALCDEGRVDLDAPIARWLPELPFAADVTLRQLLQHTSGVPDYGAVPEYQSAVRASPGRPWSDAEFAAHTWKRGLAFAPGTGWLYSNPGYALATRVCERAGDMPFAGLLESLVLAPLGLRATVLARVQADVGPIHPGWVWHGVLVSTPADVATFYRRLLTGALLRAATLDEMTRAVPVPLQRPPWIRPGYGLGLMIASHPGVGAVLGHNGAGPGFTASAFHAPDVRGGATACALVAVEDERVPEGIALRVLELAAE
jgi:D-alanyl-D-alanine carboxypeptidase